MGSIPEAKRDSPLGPAPSVASSSFSSPSSAFLVQRTPTSPGARQSGRSPAAEHLTTPKLSFDEAFGSLAGTSRRRPIACQPDSLAMVQLLHFKSPPAPAGSHVAVYEQPHLLLAAKQRRRTQPIQMPSTFQPKQPQQVDQGDQLSQMKSAFKPNSLVLGGQPTAASKPAGRRHSAARNSLESIQSRSSCASSTAGDGATSSSAYLADLRPAGGLVVVGTRFVRPPEVPASFYQASAPDEQWHSVALDGPQPPAPPPTASGPSLAARMFNKLKGSVSEPDSKLRYRLEQHKSAARGLPGQFAASDQRGPESPATPTDQSSRPFEGLPVGGGGGGKLPGGPQSEQVAAWNSGAGPKDQEAASRQIGKHKPPFLFAGILGSILGSVFFSFSMLTIKLLPDSHGLAEKTKIICFRGFMIMCLCSATIVRQKSTFLIRRDELLVNVLRSVLGFLGVYMAYVSLKYISIGDSTALIFSSPVWTSLLSHFILKEPLRWVNLLALPLSILGIVLIAHPSLLIDVDSEAGATERQPLVELADELAGGALAGPPDWRHALGPGAPLNASGALLAPLNQDLDIAVNAHEQFDYEHRWKGIAISIACSFIVSLVYIVLKFRKTTPIQTTTFWLGTATFFGALAIGCFVGFGELPGGWAEWALLLLNGVCSWLGQCLLQWGLAYEDASVLSVVRTLDVAMTFSLSALFLEETILWTSVLGAAIIAGVVVSIMLSNYLSDRFCASAGARSARSSLSLSSGDASGLDDGRPAAVPRLQSQDASGPRAFEVAAHAGPQWPPGRHDAA